MNDNEKEKMVGARLDDEHRDMLATILKRNGRTFRGQLGIWIEQEHRIVLARG